MTYRGVYRDGLVFLEGEVQLRNGEAVDVNPRGGNGPLPSARSLVNRASGVAKSGAKASARLARVKLTRQQRLAAALAVRGDWADRPEWRRQSSSQIAAALRKRAARRGPDA
jgi:hypothetical protein